VAPCGRGPTRLRAAAGRSASDISTPLWSIPLLRSTWAVSHASFANMNNRPAIDPAAILFKGVGTWGAIAVAVAGMAPTMAMNLNPQEPAEHVGRVVPLVFLLSTVVVLLVAWCFARLAHEHPNAGSAYGFVAAILVPAPGWLPAGRCSGPISALPSSASGRSVCSAPTSCSALISGAMRPASA